MFEVQNFALTKIKTISCQCGHSSLLGILKILNLPSFTLDYDDLSKVTIKFFTPINDMSYPVKSVDKFEWKTDSLYENNFSKQKESLHEIKVNAAIDFKIDLLIEKTIKEEKPEKTNSPVYKVSDKLQIIEH